MLAMHLLQQLHLTLSETSLDGLVNDPTEHRLPKPGLLAMTAFVSAARRAWDVAQCLFP
jgi:hypothetical protein